MIKRVNFNSIGVKVSLAVVCLLVLVMGVKSAVQIKHEFNAELSQGEALKLEESKLLAKELEKKFLIAYQLGASVQANVQNMVTEISQEDRNREFIIKNIVDLLKGKQDIQGVGVYFEPNRFDGADANHITSSSPTGRFAKYISRDNGSDNILIEDEEDTDKDWYDQVIKSKEIHLMEPYVDTDGQLVTSYVFPVVSGDNAIGVALVDININELQKEAVAHSNGQEDFKALITDEGTFVANAMDESMILKNLFEIVPEAKESVGKAISDGYKINDETIAGTTIEGKIIYVAVDLPGVDQKWCYESATTLNYFLADAKRAAVFSVISDMAIILLIGAIIVMILLCGISKPMALIEKGIGKLADYNLDLAEESEMAKKYITRKDEVGNVVRAVHALRTNLTEIIANITAYAENTASTSEELTATAQETASTATQVGNSVEGIAEGATNQAQDAQSLATDVENSNVEVSKMLEIVHQLTEKNEFIELKKNEGNESLELLVEANEKSTQTAMQVSDIVNETNESAERIAQASEMIKSIASQTNLLSLNAAIEAARAGESGKGFSVVAGEVKKLAEQSDRFAMEIEEVIQELKEKTNLAVEIMNQTQHIVKTQEEMLRKTEEKFEEISDSVDENKKIVEILDQSSRVVQESNARIVSLVGNLSAIAQENAASTEEMSAAVEIQVASIASISQASENLATIATDLQAEATKFRL